MSQTTSEFDTIALNTDSLEELLALEQNFDNGSMENSGEPKDSTVEICARLTSMTCWGN